MHINIRNLILVNALLLGIFLYVFAPNSEWLTKSLINILAEPTDCMGRMLSFGEAYTEPAPSLRARLFGTKCWN